jgi:hypothetical protein
MPGVFRCDRGDQRACLLLYTRCCGRIGRPAFPAPSVIRGTTIRPNLGRMAPRECGRLFRVTFQRVVPANAGTHTARTLVLALAQRPFFTFEARGDGSLRSQGRLAESSCEATIASTRGSYAIPLPASGRGELNPWTYRFNHKRSCSGSCARLTRRLRLADDCEKP